MCVVIDLCEKYTPPPPLSAPDLLAISQSDDIFGSNSKVSNSKVQL